MEEIYFSNEDTYDIVYDAFEKNGVNETEDAAVEKDEQTLSNIVLNLTRDFILGKISEPDFVSSLQKELTIQDQAAKNIIKIIKEKIIPFAEKINVVKPEERAKELQLQDHSPVSNLPPHEITRERPMPILNEKIIKDIPKPLEKKQGDKKPKQPDSYREPIK